MNDEQTREFLNQRLLGWGLACPEILPGVDHGRDLRLIDGAQGKDFACVHGMDNLAQALTIALTTRLGDDLFNTEFGFDGLNALAEETLPIMIRERLRIAVIKVLRKDPRVRRIVDVKLEQGQLEAPASGNRTLDVRVVFETISREQTAIDIGKVIPHE